MKRQAGVGALLLVCVGVVLGATVFRSDIAQATGLAQAVTINNTPAQAVPVVQQGTVDVRTTNAIPLNQGGMPVLVTFVHHSNILGGGWDTSTSPYVVPSGKTLIVTYVNGDGHVPESAQGGVNGFRFTVSHGGTETAWNFPAAMVNDQPATSGSIQPVHIMASEQTFVVAQAGDTVRPLDSADIGTGETTWLNGTVTLSGYLVAS